MNNNTEEERLIDCVKLVGEACIKVEQGEMCFSSTLNDEDDWEILEAVLRRVRNRQRRYPKFEGTVTARGDE